MNLGWGLAVIPRLMDPPKGPVSKQEPRREQIEDGVMCAQSRGTGEGQTDTESALEGLRGEVRKGVQFWAITLPWCFTLEQEKARSF